MIYLAAAQRCSFLITAKNDTTTNYAFVTSMDTVGSLRCLVIATHLQATRISSIMFLLISTIMLQDGSSMIAPTHCLILQVLTALDPFDDFTLIPYDGQELLPEPDQTVSLTVDHGKLGRRCELVSKLHRQFPRLLLKAFVVPSSTTLPIRLRKFPTLYTVMSAGTDASNAAIYGEYTHPFVLEKDRVIEIVVNNNDTGKHPFHLHGHNFQAIWRSDENAGNYVPTSDPDFPPIPMRRDTFTVHPNGNIVLRFRADNPGVWLFHCHIEWHVDSGLIATMIEAPLELQTELNNTG